MSSRGLGRRLAALGAAAVLVLAGCGSDEPEDGDGGTGGTYSVGSEEWQHLTPSNCYDLYCANIINAMFTGLLTYRTEGPSMVPALTPLTKSITPSQDNTTYTIVINPGNKFTNGEAVTAQSFVDTWNFAANGGNGQQLGFVFGPSQLNVVGYGDVDDEGDTTEKMSGLRAVDETTLEVRLEQPLGQTLFENYLAGPQIPPMPSVAFQDITAYDRQPIGNGPYKLTAAWGTTGAELERNADYSYTQGKADAISFRIYADLNTQWADLQNNSLDVVYSMNQQMLSQASTVLGDRFINKPGLTISYEAFPTQVAAFQKREVRVALAKAVDWKQIGDTLYYGTRTAATSFAPPSIKGGGQDICGADCTYDPAAAKQMLEDAGGLPGNKVNLVGYANQGNEAVTAQCNMIQQNLGVECEVRIFESFAALQDAADALGPQDEGLILGLGWTADNPTMANMLAPLFATGAGTNYTKYSNEDFDRLIAEGNRATTEEEAIAKWREAERVLYRDFTGHAIQWRNTVAGYSTNVTNVDVNPGNFLNVAEVEVVDAD